jgi:tetratricopeptide (TPR) repeat protein
MKRFFPLLILCAAAWSGFPQAIDEQYVRIYNSIQRADQLKDAGQARAALDLFKEAEAGLNRLKDAHPTWNEKVVNFRLRYVAQRIAELEKIAPAVAKPASETAATAMPARPEGKAPLPPEVEGFISSLQDEVRRLQAGNADLQGKLKEALSAMPAARDPRELARAEEQIKLLQKENEVLKASLAQEQTKAAKMADPAAMEQLQKALADSNARLSEQASAIATLRQERDALQARLQSMPAPDPDAAALRAENESLKQQVARLTTPPATGGTGDLAQQLAAARLELAIKTTRNETLLAEKTALENRLRELGASPAVLPASPAPPAATGEATARLSAVERELSDTKAALQSAQTALETLRQEKQGLLNKVAATALELAIAQQRLAGGGAAATKPLSGEPVSAEQLNNLRARLEALEARAMPYSAEELALFQQPAQVKTVADPATAQDSLKALPAGANRLLADAERAFAARKLEDAERLYKQVLGMDPNNAYTLANLAAIQIEQGRTSDATSNLQRALARLPDDAYSLTLLGMAKYREGNYEEALNHLSRAAQLDPKNPETQNYLGITLSQKGQRAAAEAALRKAIQISPGYASAHHNLAVIYATQQPPAPELARWHYNKALDNGHPKNSKLEQWIAEGRSASAK